MTAPTELLGLRTPPSLTTQRWLQAGTLITAAGLIGFGLILFIAANWDAIGRYGRFGLVASVILSGGLGAVIVPALQTPLLLIGFAATGGMLALIGQTYQTGADAWQLFALWGALTLPWAIAARSDTIWTSWAVVVMTALGLWEQTYTAWSWQVHAVPRVVVIALWIMALAIPAAFAPFSPLQQWTGPATWAFRLSLALALVLVAKLVITAIFAEPAAIDIVLVGLLCLGGVATILATFVRRDILLLSATALAIDIVLICGIVRMIAPKHSGAMAFVAIGFLAAVIIAASVVVLMQVMQLGAGRAWLPGRIDRVPLDEGRPWPVIMLSGIGAIMAAIPFIVALAILFGSALEKGPVTYVIAFITVPLALLMLRGAPSLFVEQLATVALTVGLGLLSYGLFRDLPTSLAGLACAGLAVAIAVWLGRTWIGALLGALAAASLMAAMVSLLPRESYMRGPQAFVVVWSLLALLWVCGASALEKNHTWLEPAWSPQSLDSILSGWIAAVLLGLSVGASPTFVISGTLGMGGAAVSDTLGPRSLLYVAQALSLLLACAGAGWLVREWTTLRSPLGYGIVIATVGLSALMTGLGAVVLVLAVALTRGRPVIAIAAAVAAVWIIGSFYYDLSLTLTAKAVILAATGAILGAVALVFGGHLDLPVARTTRDTTGLSAARVLTAIGLVLVGALSAQAINEKEALIRDGRPIYIELAPVDPRSLMQGDYMALRFALPDSALRNWPMTGPRPVGVGMVDANGVARLTRIGDASTVLAPSEIKIELSPKNGRWIVVTDAWFFKEGTAQKWASARFGEFRVTSDGRGLLVGLADKDLVAIK